MKKFILILSILSSSFCLENPKPLEVIHIGSYSLQGNVNNQGEFILSKYENCEDCCSHYYSNIYSQGAKVPLNENINDRLLELGYEPIQMIYDRKPHFHIYPADLDDSGNVFVYFDRNERDIFGNYVKGLGVWHKSTGFEPLQIPKIHTVSYITLNKTHLMVFGYDKAGSSRLALYSVSDFCKSVEGQ